MANIKKILILEGGFNEEHEVSLKSASEIKKIFNKINLNYKSLRVNPINFKKDITKYKNFICFNALHGPFGEDGQIQKILKQKKIKFTHSGYKSSKNCFDKVKTKEIILKNKILTPKFFVLTKKDLNSEKLFKIKKVFGKFLIKPSNSGSSFGIKILKNNQDLKNLINNLEDFKKKLKNHNKIIAEEFIVGKELTVSTIRFSKQIKALAVTEIRYKNFFFDYTAKYSSGYSKHILPAKINKKIYDKCLNLAKKSHKILGCKSIARTDFIFDNKKNKIYFLETNTQPGLTSISLLPEQAKYKNISFKEIIIGILKNLN